MSGPPKVLRRGTHRIRDPATTLARLLPLMPAMGVTRLAGLTGLDDVGLPVFAAVRPNSRTVAVHQGKGLTDEAARCSALMEAAEAWHAETLDRPLRRGAPDEIGAVALDVRHLPRARGAGDPAQARLLWVEGAQLTDGEPRWVPLELVAADYSWPQPAGAGLFQATTNGLGAGNSRAEALVHALCEAIERDAIAVWRAGFPRSRAARALGTSAWPVDVEQIAARLHACGCAVRLWDATSDIGVPVVVCLLLPSDPADGTEPELGSGCHLDPAVAALRAVTEAAQARLTRISGARDDFPPDSYDAAATAARRHAALRWLDDVPDDRRALPADLSAETVEEDVALLLDAVRGAGLPPPVLVPLDRPEIGLPVVRVVTPGLEGPWTEAAGEYAPGARARRAAARP